MVWVVVAAIAILLAVTLLAVWAFSSGDEEPGTGTGETVTTQSRSR